jgi:hypothetical protein
MRSFAIICRVASSPASTLLLRDDTCWFVALDLDGESWREDALALRAAATDLGVPVAVERSRSGDGAHVWVFFSEPVAAAQARRLASALLTEATGRRPAIGLGSYDRLFPSQDVLPDGGFGNLTALPLQREAREQGCSVFLDYQLEPFADQWRFLAGVERLDRARVDRLVAAASTRGGGVLGVADETEADEPWRVGRTTALPLVGPVPDEVRITLAQQVYVPRAAVLAVVAHRAALEAALEVAAARTAHARLSLELAATVRRLRAIESRWLPMHEQALTALEQALDENDRADGTRIRWASRHRGSDVPPDVT